MLLLFYLSASKARLSRNRLLCKLCESVVKDPAILRLISSFLGAPIIEKTGKNWSVQTGIPPVVFISDVLLNFYLDVLDRAVEVRFPAFQSSCSTRF